MNQSPMRKVMFALMNTIVNMETILRDSLGREVLDKLIIETVRESGLTDKDLNDFILARILDDRTNSVTMIRIVRTFKRLGLKEAKDYVDNIKHRAGI